jgi:hypothetical protein
VNVNDIAQQIIRMKGLMPEVNRTTVAIRFQTMITASMKSMFGDDDDRTLKWVNEDSKLFLQACQIVSPRAPIRVDTVAESSDLVKFIDKWESVDTWRLDDECEWVLMSQETINVKATMLKDLRELCITQNGIRN